MATPSPLIRLHPDDNVLVVRHPLALGHELPEFGLRTRAQLPAGHKVAARRIAAGERVRKYDVVIGAASRDIDAGEHVHGHNLALVDDHRALHGVTPVTPLDEALPAWRDVLVANREEVLKQSLRFRQNPISRAAALTASGVWHDAE